MDVALLEWSELLVKRMRCEEWIVDPLMFIGRTKLGSARGRGGGRLALVACWKTTPEVAVFPEDGVPLVSIGFADGSGDDLRAFEEDTGREGEVWVRPFASSTARSLTSSVSGWRPPQYATTCERSRFLARAVHSKRACRDVLLWSSHTQKR